MVADPLPTTEERPECRWSFRKNGAQSLVHLGRNALQARNLSFRVDEQVSGVHTNRNAAACTEQICLLFVPWTRVTGESRRSITLMPEAL
jgi:hypothetical protein